LCVLRKINTKRPGSVPAF